MRNIVGYNSIIYVMIVPTLSHVSIHIVAISKMPPSYAGNQKILALT